MVGSDQNDLLGWFGDCCAIYAAGKSRYGEDPLADLWHYRPDLAYEFAGRGNVFTVLTIRKSRFKLSLAVAQKALPPAKFSISLAALKASCFFLHYFQAIASLLPAR